MATQQSLFLQLWPHHYWNCSMVSAFSICCEEVSIIAHMNSSTRIKPPFFKLGNIGHVCFCYHANLRNHGSQFGDSFFNQIYISIILCTRVPCSLLEPALTNDMAFLSTMEIGYMLVTLFLRGLF